MKDDGWLSRRRSKIVGKVETVIGFHDRLLVCTTSTCRLRIPARFQVGCQ